MLRLGTRVRLTRKEVDDFHILTGFRPEGVRSVEDLQRYVARCKTHYWGTSYETQFLHWLIDRQVDRCHAPPPGGIQPGAAGRTKSGSSA
jgi:hypothetical protein